MPDLLICDIAMPVEDGYSLIRRIRTLSPKRGGLTPAIALTACVLEREGARSLELGFQMHVAKPVEPVELVSLVAELVRKI